MIGKAVRVVKHRVGNPVNYHGAVGYVGSHLPGTSFVGVYFPRDNVRWTYQLEDLEFLDNVKVIEPKTDNLKKLIERIEK